MWYIGCGWCEGRGNVNKKMRVYLLSGWTSRISIISRFVGEYRCLPFMEYTWFPPCANSYLSWARALLKFSFVAVEHEFGSGIVSIIWCDYHFDMLRGWNNVLIVSLCLALVQANLESSCSNVGAPIRCFIELTPTFSSSHSHLFAKSKSESESAQFLVLEIQY